MQDLYKPKEKVNMNTGMVGSRNKKLEERLVKEREEAIAAALAADPKAAKAAGGKPAPAKAAAEKKAAPEKPVKKTA